MSRVHILWRIHGLHQEMDHGAGAMLVAPCDIAFPVALFRLVHCFPEHIIVISDALRFGILPTHYIGHCILHAFCAVCEPRSIEVQHEPNLEAGIRHVRFESVPAAEIDEHIQLFSRVRSVPIEYDGQTVSAIDVEFVLLLYLRSFAQQGFKSVPSRSYRYHAD